MNSIGFLQFHQGWKREKNNKFSIYWATGLSDLCNNKSDSTDSRKNSILGSSTEISFRLFIIFECFDSSQPYQIGSVRKQPPHRSFHSHLFAVVALCSSFLLVFFPFIFSWYSWTPVTFVIISYRIQQTAYVISSHYFQNEELPNLCWTNIFLVALCTIRSYRLRCSCKLSQKDAGRMTFFRMGKLHVFHKYNTYSDYGKWIHSVLSYTLRANTKCKLSTLIELNSEQQREFIVRLDNFCI